MAFGLAGAPATFQHFMDQVLAGLKGEECFVYLDDVVIFGEDVVQHNDRLIKVLKRLEQAEMRVNLQKCKFMHSELIYLGHLVTRDGVNPDPEKIKSISEYQRPVNVKEVRAFLGLTGYYRRFIENYAARAKPIIELTKDGVEFDWTEDRLRAFRDLSASLCKPPVLCYPDFTKPFILATDASNTALGVVLSQCNEDGEHPVAYASRLLKGAELNYSATEKEMLGVVWGIKYFRCYLYGRKFTVLTDHADRKSTRLNSSHVKRSRMPSSA